MSRPGKPGPVMRRKVRLFPRNGRVMRLGARLRLVVRLPPEAGRLILRIGLTAAVGIVDAARRDGGMPLALGALPAVGVLSERRTCEHGTEGGKHQKPCHSKLSRADFRPKRAGAQANWPRYRQPRSRLQGCPDDVKGSVSEIRVAGCNEFHTDIAACGGEGLARHPPALLGRDDVRGRAGHRRDPLTCDPHVLMSYACQR